MYDIEFEENLINIRDSWKGIVVGQNRNGGLYIDMEIEDEENIRYVPAYGYWGAKVNRGTEVICSIKKLAEENKRITVRIDSVNYNIMEEMDAA